jgi:hypothetical protein
MIVFATLIVNDVLHEDNLNECAGCGAETCWQSAIHAELPKLACREVVVGSVPQENRAGGSLDW